MCDVFMFNNNTSHETQITLMPPKYKGTRADQRGY